MHEKEAKGILSAKNGLNPYRGCTHGCIYCDSRSKCYNIQHDFEDVEVKVNAPQLLAQALRSKRQRCMIGTGAMCDPYQPAELTCNITHGCLEVAEQLGFGFTVITKSDRVLRDLELFERVQHKAKCVVQMTLTTFDERLCSILEPNVCNTQRRLEVLRILQQAGIPTVVWLTPILPFLNDNWQNVSSILEGCFDAGVRGILCFGMGLTLREGNREYFYEKLDQHFPGMKEQYLRAFGNRYVCNSPHNAALMKRFHAACEAQGVLHHTDEIFTYLNTFEDKLAAEQLSLF
ncbi:MAG: hypothetical protein PWQ08_727 [Clostridiales bacterium]|jgi:DNA repair photolyase|nr:hypothetical protein [Clostridiales bacterium]